MKRAKNLLPYIDIGEANWGMARAKKKRKGANTTPDTGGRGSAYKFRQIFSTGEDPVLALFPNLMHDNRWQGGLVVENSFVPLFPDLPSDERDS